MARCVPSTGLAICLALVASGCMTPKDRAIERAMNEYGCSKQGVSARFISRTMIGSVYRVQACGRIVTYVCDSRGCLRESDDR